MVVPDLLVLNDVDSVGTALRDLGQGSVVRVAGPNGELGALTLADDIGLGHTAALVAIPEGSMVIKQGQPAGRATAEIAAGEHVHLHNMESLGANDELAADPAGHTPQ